MAITLHRPAHTAVLPTRRTHKTSRASQLVLGGLISLVAAPWALLWRSDRTDEQDALEPGRHRLH